MKVAFPSHGNLDSYRSASVPPEFISERTPSSSTFATSKAGDTPSSFGHGGDLTADEENGKRFLLHLGGRTYDFELSTCGRLSGGRDEVRDERKFQDSQVSYRRFMKSPDVVHDRNLIIRWNDR